MTLDCPDLEAFGTWYGVASARSLKAVPVKASPVVVTRLEREVVSGEVSRLTIPAADAYLLMIYLADTVHSDILSDGSLAPERHCARGTICIVDLSEGASVVLHQRLSSLAIYMPKAFVAEVAGLSMPPMDMRLRCRRAEPDAVVSDLAAVLLSLFEGGAAYSEAILKHLAIAVCGHLLQDGREGQSETKKAGRVHVRPAPNADPAFMLALALTQPLGKA